MRIPSGLKLLLYLAYALVLTSVLLYVRFPSNKFLPFLERKIEAIFNGADADLGIVQVRFPLIVHIDRLELLEPTGSGQLAMFTNVSIRPNLPGMGLSYTLDGDFYGGKFESELHIAPLQDRITLKEMKITGVQLDQYEYLKLRTRREMRGQLSISGSYTASWEDDGEREVQGLLRIEDGSFSLKRPLLALSEMDMQRLEVGFSWIGNRIELVEGTFAGKEIKAEYDGLIEMSEQNSVEQLDIAGSLVPQRDFLQENPQVLRVVKRLQKQYRKTALPFRVSGSVNNPNFQFGE